MRDCALDHTIPGKHSTGCPCGTDHETAHVGHCAGCLPKPATIGEWCQWHYDRTADALTNIPKYAAVIAAAPDGKVARRSINGDATRRMTKVDQASPSQAWDTVESAIQWAYSWAETVADYRHHRGPFTYTPAGIPVRDLQATVTYLHRHLEFIAYSQEFAGDFAREAHTERTHLERLSGSDELIHRLKDRCPTCDRKSLIRKDGADRVDCKNQDCGRVWTETEYANLAHVAAS